MKFFKLCSDWFVVVIMVSSLSYICSCEENYDDKGLSSKRSFKTNDVNELVLLDQFKLNTTDPQSVYLSEDGSQWALLDNTESGKIVYINGMKYGPFNEADIEVSSPFLNINNNWQFRATFFGMAFLYVNDICYGPYDHVWTPNFSQNGENWAAVVQKNGVQFVLINGEETERFSHIYGVKRSLDDGIRISYKNHQNTSTPNFIGMNNKWLAFGVKENDLPEFYILSEKGNSGPYVELDQITQSRYKKWRLKKYRPFITADNNLFSLTVAKKENQKIKFYLYVDGNLYGPYNKKIDPGTTFTHEYMARDGSNWIWQGKNMVYTKNESYKYSIPNNLKISCYGESYGFSSTVYVENQKTIETLIINGIEYGPYDRIGNIRFSVDGNKWIATIHDKGMNYILQYDNTFIGPYDKISHNSLFFQNDKWFAEVYDNGSLSLICEGNNISRQNESSIRSIHNAIDIIRKWHYIGITKNQYEIMINGERKDTIGPYSMLMGLLFKYSQDGQFWTMAINNEDQWDLIENGLITPLGMFDEVTLTTPEIPKKGFIQAIDYDGNAHLLLNDAQYGPYYDVGHIFKLSSDGSAWATIAVTLDYQQQVITHLNQSRIYDSVKNLYVHPDGLFYSYLGILENKYLVGFNGQEFGTFSLTNIVNTENDSKIITIEDNEIKIYKVNH